MKPKQIKNLGASVRNRLMNVAKQAHVDFNRILLLYFQERFLYRLSRSPYKNSFILKGGVLLYGAHQMKARPTKDLDFLAANLDNQLQSFVRVVKEIIAIPADDGVSFDADSIAVETLTQQTENAGIRCKLTAHLDTAKLLLQLDIGFGDVTFSRPLQLEYPVLLDAESINLAAYSWDSVVAEKFEACVKLSDLNSRMKDFFDIHFLLSRHDFEGNTLRSSLLTTFRNRTTNISDAAHIFSEEFYKDADKQRQWMAFLRTIQLPRFLTFAETVLEIKTFLAPVIHSLISEAAYDGVWNVEKRVWKD